MYTEIAKTQRKEKMMKVNAFALILIIIFVSFLGFITENIFIFARHGFIDNRNMVLPFLLGYGLAILIIFKLFGTPNTPLFFTKELYFKKPFISSLYYFIISFLCVSIGELILGHLIEWSCNIIWWDYTSLPFHVTKYTSVPTSFLFASMITVFMKYLFDPMLNMFAKIPYQVLSIITITLIVLLGIDFIHSGIYMFKNREILQLWRIEFEHSLIEIFDGIKINS